VGIPLLVATGFFRRKRPLPREWSSLAVLKTAAIGDTILLSAALSDLRRSFPAARIVLLTGSDNYEAGRLLRGMDEVVRLDVRRPLRSLLLLRERAFDLFLDFGSWPRLDAVLATFSRSRWVAGFETPGQFRHCGFDLAVPHSGALHELENYRNLLRTLGVEPSALPAISPGWAPKGGAAPGLPYAVFHPWPGGFRKEFKEWPFDRWIRLAVALSRLGYRVVVTGGVLDRERSEEMAGRGREAGADVRTGGEDLSLSGTAAILRDAAFLVTVDTGVMHLGAALGIPMVALQGPAPSRRWGPLSDRAIVLESPCPGCGYLNLGFEYPDDPPDCMGAITEEMVLGAVRALIASRGEGSPS